MEPDERGRFGLFTRARKRNIRRSQYAASCIILSRRGRTVALRRVCPAGCYAFEMDATRPPLRQVERCSRPGTTALGKTFGSEAKEVGICFGSRQGGTTHGAS